MTKKEIESKIEKITKGERFITPEQFEQLEEVPHLYLEDCGISGTGKGILYTLYPMDQHGDKMKEEIGEVVVKYE